MTVCTLTGKVSRFVEPVNARLGEREFARDALTAETTGLRRNAPAICGCPATRDFHAVKPRSGRILAIFFIASRLTQQAACGLLFTCTTARFFAARLRLFFIVIFRPEKQSAK